MIRAEGVVHRYGGTAAVDDVSMTVADGECVLLAGPNGSGKTTLVRHFNGLLEPDEGSVTVDGTPVADDLVAARSAVGMVFQEPRDQFVAATVGADVAFGPENLGLDPDAVEERVREALTAVGMADRREERIADLSGGERARVAVAGALAMDPAHLVLDEPFAGLDWPARRSVRDRVETLLDAGRSVVLVSHDLRDAADLADRAVVLVDGAVAARGTVAELHDRFADLGVRPPC
jgi:biotin transport system ATP-binding protein